MQLDSKFVPEPAATRRPDCLPAGRILLVTATLAAVVPALTLPASWSGQRAAGVTASVAASSASHPATGSIETPRPAPRIYERVPRFFGFLEFDWDLDAPEGVPGFDPWSDAQERR